MQQIKTIAAIMIILIFAASCKKETSEISAPSPTNQKKVVEEKNQRRFQEIQLRCAGQGYKS
jgi:hypothetical protein